MAGERAQLDAWFSRQSERLRSGALFNGSRDAADAIGRADAALRPFRFGEPRRERALNYAGRAYVQADDGAARFAAGLLEAAGPALADAVREEVFPFVEHAIEQWPVETGRSRAALTLDVRADPSGLLELTFFGADPKTYFVRYAGVKRDDVRRRQIVDAMRVRLGGDQRLVPDAVADEIAAQFASTRGYVRAVWNQRGQPVLRRKYTLPGGGDPAGLNAWSAQARIPFRPMFARLRESAGVKIGTSAARFSKGTT